jgi:D-inositol-3-phosphate glycosyltransferase
VAFDAEDYTNVSQFAKRLGKKAGVEDNALMRVAMISYHTCPLATLGGKDTGGMNVYVRDLSRELGRHRIGVDVFTRSQDVHVPHVLHDLGFGNRVVHIPAGPEDPVEKRALHKFLPEFQEGILDFANTKGLRYSLIHSHYWLSGLAGLYLRNVWSAPVVHMFHTLGKMKQRVARSQEEEPSPERLEGEMRLLRTADRIVAATQAEVAQFQWLYKADTHRVTVIPPGVDTTHFYPIDRDEALEFIGGPHDKDMLLFVGRIEPLKGIDTLLRAVAMLAGRGVLRKHPLCLAVLGGETGEGSEGPSPEMDRLRALRESLGIDDIVTFLGRRDQDTLQYYYSAAKVVVVPSHYESFGLVALEAMACGTPVVASETGGLAFLVRDGETGFHVPADDTAALAERLLRLLEDDVLRSRMSQQAVAYAKGYDWSIIADKIIRLYEGMLGGRTA